MQVEVELRNLPGTEAAVGWAGNHTIVADRPAGKAGGQGLGFNGAQLLALSLGGCFCNDLRYVAQAMGVEIGELGVRVSLTLEGDPLITTAAQMSVTCKTPQGTTLNDVITQARATCMVANSLSRGLPVTISVT